MKLTVLGTFGPFPPAGGACSGFLVEHEDFKVLLDCGNGVLSRLQKFVSIWDVDAIFISHLHSDHVSDLFILRYALDIALNKEIITQGIDLYAPENPAEEAARLPYKNAYQVKYIQSGDVIEAGPFIFKFNQTVHPVYNLASKILWEDKSLVYTGDTEYFPEMEKFIAGCDLLICEANYQNEDMQEPRKNHLSALQAGKMAHRAEVKKMLLTHLPAGRNLHTSLAEAAEAFPNAELALEEETYII